MRRSGLQVVAQVAQRCLFGLLLAAEVAVAQAGEVSVAVAANFTAPMTQIAADFEKATGHKALLSYGATGKFYAQITQGAPFDVLLAADTATPTKLAQEGRAVKATQFTYAQGRLALWSAKPGVVDAQGEVLKRGQFRFVAIASPRLAPYGAAAIQTLEQLGLRAAIEPKLVLGESIGQALTMVASGNAELGFVSVSQVFEGGKLKSGSAWLVPASLYSAITQDAVVLNRGQTNPAAAALMTYLKNEKATSLITSFGYGLPGQR